MLPPSKTFAKPPTNHSKCPSDKLCKSSKIVKRCTASWSRRRYVVTMVDGDRRTRIITFTVCTWVTSALGNKRFNVDMVDSMIVDKVQRYTWFIWINFQKDSKGFPSSTSTFYIKDIKQIYKSILLRTNVHTWMVMTFNMPMMNKEQTLISWSLTETVIKVKWLVLYAMKLTNDRINYVHWNDP